jgi:hypothetical protein
MVLPFRAPSARLWWWRLPEGLAILPAERDGSDVVSNPSGVDQIISPPLEEYCSVHAMYV